MARSANPSDEAAPATQQHRVLVELRERILAGDLPGGSRLAEVPLSERLGVSRTPVRAALVALEREGLADPLPGGGYTVRRFSTRDIADAIEVRAHLEGMAARLIAERGADRALVAELDALLALGDDLVSRAALDAADFGAYAEMNHRLHETIVRAADNSMLARCVALINGHPFSAAGAMLSTREHEADGMALLRFAHRQHHQLVDAIRAGQGARAQALATEHALIALVNFESALAIVRADAPPPEAAAR